jgi:hypothetical protein
VLLAAGSTLPVCAAATATSRPPVLADLLSQPLTLFTVMAACTLPLPLPLLLLLLLLPLLLLMVLLSRGLLLVIGLLLGLVATRGGRPALCLSISRCSCWIVS